MSVKQLPPKPTFGTFFRSFAMWFLIFFILIQGYNMLFGEDPKEETLDVSPSIVEIKPVKKSYRTGNLVVFSVHNLSGETLQFDSPCEGEDAEDNMKIYYVTQHREEIIRTDISGDIIENCTAQQIPSWQIGPDERTQISFTHYNHQIFSEEGNYELEIVLANESGEALEPLSSQVVKIKEPNWFIKIFRALVTRPLFNVLVAFTQYMPGHSYGWAIVFLTLLVRLALFIPNQKAMKSQRRIQKIQPQLMEIRKQYKDNPQMQTMKTMELYKTEKVNPFGSILPIFLQMPFLIGIFYLLQDGISPHLSYLLYGFYSHPDLTAGDNIFFGLDLGLGQAGNGSGQIVLAVLVALTQFAAVKLSMHQTKKRQAQNPDTTKKENKKDDPAEAMQKAGKMMMYFMPLLVGFFTLSLPAGVGIYWLTSTLFGAGQQQYVNYQLDQPQLKKKKKQGER